jgi:small multidrug resistance pump
MSFVYLMLAIATEVVGSSSLKASEGFSKPLPSVLVVIFFGLAFSFLSLALKDIPLGTAYAIWSGLGTAATVAISVVIWKEQLNIWSILGVALIILGVVVLQLLGKAAA